MPSGGVSPSPLFDMALAYRKSKTLLTAVELGLFSVVASQPLNARQLAERLDLHVRGAGDFFDALVALGLLVRDGDGRYGNGPSADQFLDRAKPDYIVDVMHRASRRAYANWNNLPSALRTGKPQSGTFGTDGYPALYEDPAALEAFVRAMSGSSLLVVKALARCLDWSRYTRIIDIGTAEGCVPVQLALAHPHLVGSGLDLPAVEPFFTSYVARHGLSERLRFCAGDFHSDPFPPAEVIVMGRVLHNWDFASKSMLLSKAYSSLPSGGSVIVWEMLIDDARRVNNEALLASLHMLIETATGHEATGADYIAWLKEAGFSDPHVQDLGCAYSAVIGFKR